MFVAVALKGNNSSNKRSNNNSSNNNSSNSQKKRPKQSCGSRRCKVSKIVWEHILLPLLHPSSLNIPLPVEQLPSLKDFQNCCMQLVSMVATMLPGSERSRRCNGYDKHSYAMWNAPPHTHTYRIHTLDTL